MRVHRDDWATLVAEFQRFFGPLGEVTLEDDAVEFSADPAVVVTGLELRRDGTSHSFMPLHDMRAGWHSVEFSDGAVSIIGNDATYVYRVPPALG